MVWRMLEKESRGYGLMGMENNADLYRFCGYGV